MADRKEILGVIEYEAGGEKKSYWTKIGTAFMNRDGSFNLRFDYFPANLATKIQVRDPRPPREGYRQQREQVRESHPQPRQREPGEDLPDDDIPFA